MAKKTLKQAYEELNDVQKRAFVTRLATVAHKSEFTVKMWLCGRQIPDELTRIAVAKELGVSAEGLFPEVDNIQTL